MGIIIGFIIGAIILIPISLWYLYRDIKAIKKYGESLVQCKRCKLTYNGDLSKCPHCKNISDANMKIAIKSDQAITNRLRRFMIYGSIVFFMMFLAGLLNL